MSDQFFSYEYPKVLLQLKKAQEMSGKILNSAPSESLRVRKKGNAVAYYITMKDTEHSEAKEYYLRKNDPRLPNLINKYCAQRLFSASRNSLKILRTRPQSFNPGALNMVYEQLHSLFGDSLPYEFYPMRIHLQEWEYSHYRKNPLCPEDKRFKTQKGDLVRSKIECVIANLLYSLQIPYRYESELKLRFGMKIFPDFTMRNPVDGSFFYLEVCGMMDHSEYVSHLIQRINQYGTAGIFLGKSLLLVMETANQAPDLQVIENTLKAVVLKNQKMSGK